MFLFLFIASVFAVDPVSRSAFVPDAFFGVGSHAKPDSAAAFVQPECIDLTGDYYTNNPDDGTLKTVSFQQRDCLYIEVYSREGCFNESYKLHLDGQRYPATENEGEINFISSRWKDRQLMVSFESHSPNDPATYINFYRLDENRNLVRSTTIVRPETGIENLPDDTFLRFRPQPIRLSQFP